MYSADIGGIAQYLISMNLGTLPIIVMIADTVVYINFYHKLHNMIVEMSRIMNLDTSLTIVIKMNVAIYNLNFECKLI